MLGALLLAAALTQDPAFDERVHLGVGVSGLSYLVYGSDSYFRYKGEHPIEFEVGFAHRLGRYFEIGASYALVRFANLAVLHRVPVSARVMLPLGSRTELGLSARFGPLYVTADRMGTPVHMWGWAGGPRLDLRHWFDHRFGMVFAAEAWWARGDVVAEQPESASPYLNPTMFALSVPTASVAGIVRF
ncbi:MAG: hypothetical protein JNL79_14655 [Myxococcales bacterium]|nr:hypothetical protein [Myxococcales bacterium]